MTKTCTRCRLTKPLAAAFAADRNRRDGRSPWCRACHAAYGRENAKRISERKRARYQANPTRDNVRSRAWRAANPERCTEYRCDRYAANPERAAERSRAWQQANPERRRQSDDTRRAKKAGAWQGYVIDRFSVFERDNWTCQLCHEPIDPTLAGRHPMMATIDHVVPFTRGGLHTYKNVQAAHFGCNSAKKGELEQAAEKAA